MTCGANVYLARIYTTYMSGYVSEYTVHGVYRASVFKRSSAHGYQAAAKVAIDYSVLFWGNDAPLYIAADSYLVSKEFSSYHHTYRPLLTTLSS